MNLKHENIHEYVIKCTNTTQITLDDDFNVMDSKPDIDLIVKEWGMASLLTENVGYKSKGR